LTNYYKEWVYVRPQIWATETTIIIFKFKKMKRINFVFANFFSLIIILASSISVKAQSDAATMPDSVKHFLDTVVNIIHKEALNRDSVNWALLTKEVYEKAANANKLQDVIPAIQYIFDQLHDNHGAIIYKHVQFGSHKTKPSYSKELMEQIKTIGMPPKLKVKILENNYGYILIPSINSTNVQENSKYAQEIKDSIYSISSKKLKGWIIDLRLNPGGNMYPMIGGIGAIIGDGKAGTFINNNKQILNVWSIKNGDVYVDTTHSTYTINRNNINYKGTKIAVLIGPITQSAGEATAISMKGRPNTRFFGENTGGFTTGNITHALKDNISLLVAASIETDRNNNVYRTMVTPDVLIYGGDNFLDLNNDKKIEAALSWLKTAKIK